VTEAGTRSFDNMQSPINKLQFQLFVLLVYFVVESRRWLLGGRMV
jgi:hypothetical protein